MTSGSATMSYTVMRGLSEWNGSWKMYCRRRRKRSSRCLSSARTSIDPSAAWKVTEPASGWTARMMILDTVVLPQPLSPTRPNDSPRRIAKLTSSTATISRVSPPNQLPLRVR